MAKFLNSYGHRVQKSAFEACLTEKQYDNFIAKLEKKVNKDDNVRIYKLYSVNEVKAYGEEREDFEEVVVVWDGMACIRMEKIERIEAKDKVINISYLNSN